MEKEWEVTVEALAPRASAASSHYLRFSSEEWATISRVFNATRSGDIKRILMFLVDSLASKNLTVYQIKIVKK